MLMMSLPSRRRGFLAMTIRSVGSGMRSTSHRMGSSLLMCSSKVIDIGSKFLSLARMGRGWRRYPSGRHILGDEIDIHGKLAKADLIAIAQHPVLVGREHPAVYN